jgi:energy-coupling factor transporter ATP-binding protein EcfA2
MIPSIGIQDGKDYDPLFAEIIDQIKNHSEQTEDDALLLFVGSTGSGKSTLAAHAITRYDPTATVECVGLTKDAFLDILKLAIKQYKEGRKNNTAWYDEVDADKLRSMSSWVVDLNRFYMTNRIFKILHCWCWPSVDTLTKTLIEVRVNGIFFCKKGSTPREYIFYPKDSLNRLYNKYGGITNNILLKHEDDFGLYKGHYRKCEGKFWEAYSVKKLTQAEKIATDFFDKHASESITYGKASKMLGLTRPALMNLLPTLEKEGVRKIGEPMTESTIEKIRMWYETSKNKEKALEKEPLSDFQGRPTINRAEEKPAEPPN